LKPRCSCFLNTRMVRCNAENTFIVGELGVGSDNAPGNIDISCKFFMNQLMTGKWYFVKWRFSIGFAFWQDV
jgi:hypothetical protein